MFHFFRVGFSHINCNNKNFKGVKIVIVLLYLKDMLSIFFRWRWAAITGVATLLAFFGVGQAGITLSNYGIALLILFFFLFIFLTISVLVQGYTWFRSAQYSPDVVSCIPARSEPPESEVFQIRSLIPLQVGQVISILRATDRGTGCLGILAVERELEGYLYQCSPLWISPPHKKDLTEGQLQISQLQATLFLNKSDLQTYVQDYSKLGGQE